jgi:hypothetical protein
LSWMNTTAVEADAEYATSADELAGSRVRKIM